MHSAIVFISASILALLPGPAGAVVVRNSAPVSVLRGAPAARALSPVKLEGLGPIRAQSLSQPAVPSLGVPILVKAVSPQPAAQPAAPVLQELGRTLSQPASERTAALALNTAFDGSQARPGRQQSAETPAAPAAPDAVAFNGLVLPKRMFSDQDAIGDTLVKVMDAAQESIELAILELNLRKYSDALLRAQARGVRVSIVMDERRVYPDAGRTRPRELQALLDGGVAVRTLRGQLPMGMMHNKISVFDGKLLMTGSFNWSHAADNWHFENAIFRDDAHFLTGFSGYLRWLREQSRAYDRKRTEPDNDALPRPPLAQDTLLPVRFYGQAFPAYGFSPSPDTEEWLLQAIGLSRESIDLAMFSLTSQDIMQALMAARRRGVRIRIVFDERNAGEFREMRTLIKNGFDVLVLTGRNREKGALHSKFAIFDGRLMETGSYNWTGNARDNNYENLVFLDDSRDVAAFLGYFERLRGSAWAPKPQPTARRDDASRSRSPRSGSRR
ncbi:MAG: phospholipase D-like domain-containing protein [Elusimicrobiota bacterium]|jgi:phosphatidylserine/phosphatidylglycerophosphate/cardiolipin synthase-like enzyme